MEPAVLADNLIHRVNVGDSLTRTARRRPDNVAVVDGDRSWTYAELDAWVNRVAHALARDGYTRGDAFALASGNSAEFLAVYYACAKLGVVCVPMNLGWREKEIGYVLDHSEAKGLAVEAQLAAAMAPAVRGTAAVRDVVVLPGLGGEDADFGDATVRTLDALLDHADDGPVEVYVEDRDALTFLYTSGTTSFPKGVVGNHTAIYLESMMMCLEAQFVDDDVFVAMMPMFHTAQINCHCTSAVIVGATIRVERAFDPGRLLATIEEHRVTQIFGLPMMYRAMLDHPAMEQADVSSLRRALYAMAPMPEALVKRCVERFDCGFYLLFGQTEMSPTTTLFRPEHQLSHNGAAGTPVVNVEVAIMDDEGRLLPQGEQGHIVYRGPQTMTAYLKNPEATAEAFAHGWFHSGDVGVFDADGLLWFKDRSKDVIKTGGENVASIEVEKAVYAASPDVAEVVVVGLPHEHWTEAITAFVVPVAGASIDEAALIAEVKGIIDPYKAPKAVVLVDALPKTSTGKIQKNVVRDEHALHYGGDDA
ncbi:long-chain-fatty-acid--CoA ligase [Nocardioides mangrovicus]|uniref:Long-chain-fatty-acid--CoA ligase n=1 Tax=Nocardioides mangrovicus TaxID=2478913 RepID=A0A3L8P7K3_9ACTN|nr:long-chain-fatty-acid--CoA ligase [Nocardioides mangrovicus]RLV50927.1 long-chain-fatty-acid--CoA ligase [Nocardioides mangrovicus]